MHALIKIAISSGPVYICIYVYSLRMYCPLNCYFNSIGSMYLSSPDKPLEGDCGFVLAFFFVISLPIGRSAHQAALNLFSGAN